MSPAVVASPSSPSLKDASKSSRRAESAHGRPRARNHRAKGRRGPRRADSLDSDDEIERAALSDASDSDDASLLDSASDSESESESIVLHNGRPCPDTPSTTQSPPPGGVETAAALNGFSGKKADGGGSESPRLPRSAPAFLSSGVDWSDMVAEAGANGDSELPVIDFADLHEHAASEPPRLTNQEDASSLIVSNGDKVQQDDASSQQDTERPLRASRTGSRGGPSPSARQAYQQRLQNDPSFVPTVGDFWGHDDRLLQKDLRSLSGWWRGRWQGRGRGRGGFVGRGMRGRGPSFGGPGPVTEDGEEAAAQAEPSNSRQDAARPTGVPPIDKAWTHDRFEELKTREERRRAEKRAVKANNRSAQPNGVEGSDIISSRGGFAARGRGANRNVVSPTSSRGGSALARLRAQPDRPWFAMKPEHVWTKQFEGFLYSEPSLRPRNGQPAGYRVSLPGKSSEIVRVPAPKNMTNTTVGLRSQPPSEVMAPTEVGSRTAVVKLPTPPARKGAYHEEPIIHPEPITTVEDLAVDTHAEPPVAGPSSIRQETTADAQRTNAATDSQPPAQDNMPATPGLTRKSSLSEKSVTDDSDVTNQTAELTLENEKPGPEMVPIITGQLPPPIQTSFLPPVQPTPLYASPPYAYPASLPPGVALNQQGFAYEVATGRPVYMQPTPPPQQMHIFNPRPIPFVPGHMHHPSLSGDFMQAPSTPPINGMVDPSTGQPFFSLPRQSSRVEIRAPSDMMNGQVRVKQERRPTTLRSSTVVEPNGDMQQQLQDSGFMPPGVRRYVSAPEYYPSSSINGTAPQITYQSSDGAALMSPGSDELPQVQQQSSLDPSMMGYPPYQHQYYYPEQYYPAYVEMPQQQPGQYDPYNADPRQPPPVYY